MKLLQKIRQHFCKHVMTPPEIVSREDWQYAEIENPLGTIKCERQFFKAKSTCVKCGFVNSDIQGYNTRELPDADEKDRRDKETYIRSLSRDEIVKVYIIPHIYKTHPNPKNYLDWLATQPDDFVFRTAMRIESK